MNQNTKMLIGAVVAAVLAIAVYYGAISQQTANSIQNQTNQSLGTSPAGQQVVPPTSQNTATPPQAAPASQNGAATAPH